MTTNVECIELNDERINGENVLNEDKYENYTICAVNGVGVIIKGSNFAINLTTAPRYAICMRTLTKEECEINRLELGNMVLEDNRVYFVVSYADIAYYFIEFAVANDFFNVLFNYKHIEVYGELDEESEDAEEEVSFKNEEEVKEFYNENIIERSNNDK
jgi:hypothetical protein